MKIKDIAIKNFRLLEEVKLNVEDDLTLIVGKTIQERHHFLKL